MSKYVLAIALALASATVASAQPQMPNRGSQSDQERCQKDAVKFCRKVLDQGDFAVLACLQQNRQKISQTCRSLLEENGQ